MKIARVATIPLSFTHVKNVFLHLVERGDRVTLVSSPGDFAVHLAEGKGIEFLPITIERGINPWRDLISVFQLTLFFRQNKFDIVHSTTPKAGLLCAIAGALTRRSIHLHTFTGQRWVEMQGPLRKLLKAFDRLVIKLNHQCYTDSPAQVKFLETEGIAEAGQLKCLGFGSNGGVDTKRYDRSKYPNARKAITDQLKIPSDAVIFLFAGRFHKDKGIAELIEAFIKLHERNPTAHLLLVGGHEDGKEGLSESVRSTMKQHTAIHEVNFVPNLEIYYAAADVFCLPSYREGLSVAALEASASSLPVIGSDIPGVSEIVMDDITGLRVKVRDPESLLVAMTKLLNDPRHRSELGKNAREHVMKHFDSSIVAKAQRDEYVRLLKARAPLS